MLWEALVTDGHVRAARFRLIAIPLVILGLVCVVLAAPPGGLFFAPFPTPALDELSQNFRERAAEPVLQKFGQLQPVSVTPEQIKTLAPASELADVTSLILKSLRSTDALPKDIPIQDVPADAFWSFNWPATAIVHVSKGDIHAFGAIVTPPADQQSPYPAVRWLAIFKKQDGKWQNVAVTWGDTFFVPPGTVQVPPNQIPVTLRSLMNLPEFTP